MLKEEQAVVAPEKLSFKNESWNAEGTIFQGVIYRSFMLSGDGGLFERGYKI